PCDFEILIRNFVSPFLIINVSRSSSLTTKPSKSGLSEEKPSKGNREERIPILLNARNCLREFIL
ncbi:hypothetical protein, partial [Rhizobium leguminosarum]|uniref:hypothetical protein n=1 Tax=Rhizobium leguminosarum TaxID=384 RepID=UPI003F9B497A